VPTVYREPKGLYILEAWAAGVPVVQPRHGSFPELLELGEGGILVRPEDAADLAMGINQLLQDAPRRRELGRLGESAVRRQFHAERMADETLLLFRKHISRQNEILVL
jgi:glycosyltransferase involved in cell wall biosynthesis